MVTKLINTGFNEGEMVEERFLTSDKPAKSTKIAADTTFVDTTEGGIPITKAEQIARKNTEAVANLDIMPGELEVKPFQLAKDYIANPVYQAWDKVGRSVVDKLNPLSDSYFQDRKDLADQAKMEKSKAFEMYREKRDKTKDALALLAPKYKDKSDLLRSQGKIEEADAVLEQYFAAKNRILKAANLTETDIIGQPIDLDTYMLRDDMDLWTDNPDPYPWLQFGEKFAASVYGTNVGYKAGEKLLTNKNLQKFNQLFKAASKTGPWYVRAGGWAGRGLTHPWTVKTLGALGVGGVGWGSADFGYELQLDAMNAAGKSKAYLQSSDDIRANMFAKAIPEFATFGPEGINRPGIGQRTFNAIDEAVTDVALTAPFFMLRPAYNMLRKGVSQAPGISMFKTKQSKYPQVESFFKETTPTDDLMYAEYLWNRYGGKYIEVEKAGFNIPFVGNAITRLSQSNIFDFMSTGGLSLLGKKIKGFQTPATQRPRELEQIYVPMGKDMFSNSFVSMVSSVLGRAPWLGGRIQQYLEKNSNSWLVAFDNMLGSMAPISHLAQNGALDFGKIMYKGANKFKDKAKELNDAAIESAAKVDAPISDAYLRQSAIEVIKQRQRYWQSQMVDGTMRKKPPEGGDPLVNFIQEQILNAASTGTRDIYEAIGIKGQIMAQAEKLGKNTPNLEKDIMTLLKGWDNDIAALAMHGMDDVATAFKNYDEFVANGMLLYGSDIAKKAGLDMKSLGIDLRIAWDDKRTAQSLFDTVIKSGTKQDVQIVKKLVGDQAFADGVDLYIRNAFNRSLTDNVKGVRKFNFDQFRQEIGLGKGQSIEREIFKEALNTGRNVIRGMDPKTGKLRSFQDEMWLGMAPSGRFIDDAAEFAKKQDGDVIRTNLPTLDDFDKLITVMERVYKNGVPDVSTFMARKAVISSTNRGLTAFLPWSGAGTAGAAYASGLINGAMIKALAGAWLLRYGGGVISSPVSMRVFRNTIDDTLPETIRMSNFLKLVNRHPEEWDAFHMDMLELEDAQQKKEAGAERMRDIRSRGEKLTDNIMNLGGEILENIPEALRLGNKVLNRESDSVPLDQIPAIEENAAQEGAIEGAAGAADAAQEAASNQTPNIMPATAGFGTSLAAPGSSIAMNTNMNPDAAGALYSGNTDMALAAQYGGARPVMAAQGGMMDMNPIMDNKGNYTKPQTEINDNPFTKKSQGSGIMGVL
tara:strand:- start:915 stop:4523 length:3609 start_codon:yes stop_codon:yes gene_type:complete